MQVIFTDAWLLELLKMDVNDLRARCRKEGVSIETPADKPKLQAGLLHALANRSPASAPPSCLLPSRSPAASAAAAACPEKLRNEMVVAMQRDFEPRFQQLTQCTADLAAHNAVQDILVEQSSTQLADTTAQLQAT